jgi:hypothetical protein
MGKMNQASTAQHWTLESWAFAIFLQWQSPWNHISVDTKGLLYCFLICFTGVWMLGFTLAWEALYHLSHTLEFLCGQLCHLSMWTVLFFSPTYTPLISFSCLIATGRVDILTLVSILGKSLHALSWSMILVVFIDAVYQTEIVLYSYLTEILLFFEMGSCYVAKAGLKHLDSSNSHISTSQ